MSNSFWLYGLCPLSMTFSRQEHWSELPWPLPGDLPNPGIKPTFLISPALAGTFYTTSWWAAVYGVAQSPTQLKWLSSSSSVTWEAQLTWYWPINDHKPPSGCSKALRMKDHKIINLMGLLGNFEANSVPNYDLESLLISDISVKQKHHKNNF